MNNIMIFENKQVEVFELNGQILFNPKHVADCLSIKNINDNISKMNEKQVVKLTNSKIGIADFRKLHNTGENFLTESGVYKLIFKSRKEEAERFQNWVTDEVLPTLRKTGSYIVQPKTPIQNLEELKVKASQDRAKAMLLNAQNRMLKTLSKVVDNNKLSPIAVEVLGIKSIQEITGNKNLEQYLPQVPKTYSATEIGNILGVTANKIGSLAKSHNLKTEENGMWVMDKSKYINKEVSTFRYFENAINVFRGLLA